jgi:predicted DNA-binding ribbon-helix-helix protein
MKTELFSKNVVINGFRTSLRMEAEIWEALDEICVRERMSLNELCSLIEVHRTEASRTSLIRTFIVAYLRAAATRPRSRSRKSWIGRSILAGYGEDAQVGRHLSGKLSRMKASGTVSKRPAQVGGNA